ncbi:hypothetical protein OG895_36335 [Streptomyces sp. NBC_00201]|uniref:hypothetical protein n=1 Tax=unclassified Streptomyces TaxID=2593676 RepID=UPI00224E3C51|nr:MULTISPECIES: hypothetical protein [unclassified Streptomyces]MCX5250609.1 hypothetical protein [Streptomyces sp. NBC_00201]MCX5291462.1 hypothetical protein [Streptomyces sp. NBC_00183]
MDESRQSSSGPGAVLRRFAPVPALCGFLLLLALMFTVSYAVGVAAGPVAPGMHGSRTGSVGGGGGGGIDMGDMDMGGSHEGGR